MIQKIFLVVLVLSTLALCEDPPKLPASFQIAVDETYIQSNVSYRVNGQWYYDSINNRERIDRTNGRYNLFCSSILPNTTTPCTLITANNKRWIILSQKKTCCFCCDSDHGCGILKRDWLEDATFLGVDKIIDTNYNKWSKDGLSYNHFWTTIDTNELPRRLDEGGSHITDYLVHTYVNKTFDDSIFALPDYCKDSCPATTICGKFREGPQFVKFQ